MTDSNDIAIVGMALRVPGAATPEQFWQNLCSGTHSLQQYSDEQLRARGVSSSLLNDPRYVRADMPLAGFDLFDPEFFGFSPKEAAILDPQHRQFYEVAWEALERAGCAPARNGGAIGVFAGCGTNAYFAQNILRNAALVRSVGTFLLRHTGNDKDFLATRVSYAFDLKGPSIGVQTACSSSLVATHIAVQSLLARETDVALAGGVTIEVPQGVGYLYQEGEILSPDGHCRPFDHLAEGTVFGSGAAVVVLRRLEDALRDGDHIHAVIKASAVNNDGASKAGYLAPSVEGQAAAIAEALALCGADGSSLGFIECHGTGTPMGDPIEVAALRQAFATSAPRATPCLLGSVKSNIGHLDTAAGVIGLIKAALALEHEEIPATVNFSAPNPALQLEGGPFLIASQRTPWQRSATVRRAGVNSLGVGGTNAFVVLQEPPLHVDAPRADRKTELLVLSARNRKALDDYSLRLAQWLHANPDASLARVAASLGRGRKVFEERRVLAAQTVADAAALLEYADPRRVFSGNPSSSQSIVFMFPGGGAQYPAMGRELYAAEPAFRAAMDEGLSLLRSAFGVDLRSLFLGEPGTPSAVAMLQKPSVQLPLIFLVEQALVELWKSFGISPDAMIGHSMGENTAAYVAGVMSLKDALGLVLLRGQLMDELPGGGMLSVALPAAELQGILGEDLDLAAANAPSLSVASGSLQALAALETRLATRGVESRRIRIDIAAHSRMLDGILLRFAGYLRGIALRRPHTPLLSNLTGTWLTAEQATDPDYWVRHLRGTVQFEQGVQVLLEQADRLFIEIGPGATLGSLVRQAQSVHAPRTFASLRQADDPVPDSVHFRTVAGRIWMAGAAISEAALWDEGARRIPLPGYAFQHSRFWIEPSAPDRYDEDERALLPERLSDSESWLTGPRWVQQGILETTPLEGLTWCVFGDQDPITRRCIGALREQGHRVVVVIPGDAYSRIDDETYTLAPESGGAAYQLLVEALIESDRLPDRVLHTLLLTRGETFRPGKTFLHRNQECGFYSLFYLARAFQKRTKGKQCHWTVFGNGCVSVGGEPLAYPDKATVLGATQVIPREVPGITCTYVDIPLVMSSGSRAMPPDQELNYLAYGAIEELRAPPHNGIIAWRDRTRWIRYLAPHRGKSAGNPASIRQGGVYVITGGGGGIARLLTLWLAREFKAKLVLMSRTPMPPRADWNQWLADHPPEDSISARIQHARALELLGSEVLHQTLDVAVAEQVEDAQQEVAARFGVVHGVFHTAGVLRDGLLALKSERDVEEVFAAKLYGTIVLDRVFRESALDFMVLFSSVSAFVAPAGQIDYVAANSFLNAFAESTRGQRRYPVIAIDWGIWKSMGMTAGNLTPQTHEDQASVQIARSHTVPVTYPVFRERLVSADGTAQVHWIIGRLSSRIHWFIDEHRLLRGDALMPATGFLELLRAALAEIGEPPQGWSTTALSFLQPLYVADDDERDIRIRLQGAAGIWRVEFHADYGAPGKPDWHLVTTARTAPAMDRAMPRVDVAAMEQRCTKSVVSAIGKPGIRTRQEVHLRFGPRWRVLQQLRLGEREAVVRVSLPAALRADLQQYPLHPALLDIATGCAMDLIPGYAAQEAPENLWVPVNYGRFASFGPMPAEFCGCITLHPESSLESGYAAFDIRLCDEAGEVFAVVERLTLRRLDGELPKIAPIVQMRPQPKSPAERALAHNIARGIEDDEGIEMLRRTLASLDRPVLVVSPLAPADLIRQANAAALMSQSAQETRFSRPTLESAFEAPRDEIERSLAEMWGRLLGVEAVGIRDNFFELGGHSLIAVRLFNEIADQHGVELPLSVLVQHPDVASLAETIRGGRIGDTSDSARQQSALSSYSYLVPMHAGAVGAGRPLFIVAGMFGNVLNLSHLAHLLGEDRPFFAIQARGLFGEQSPHESFEAMARDYLLEVRRVQPTGPYLLGGFSGGGLIAFEMARQLLEAGEQVLPLVLLDTPIRSPSRFSFLDKIEMAWPRLRRERMRFFANKLRERRAWALELKARAQAREAEGAAGVQFKSQRVGDAFLRALSNYRVPRLEIAVTLFRPRLNIKHRLADGRLIDADRNVLLHDNGWAPHVRAVRVVEVPGNHDSMVLEPNVRVLVSSLRRVLGAATDHE